MLSPWYYSFTTYWILSSICACTTNFSHRKLNYYHALFPHVIPSATFHLTNYSRSCLTLNWPKPWSLSLHSQPNFKAFQTCPCLGCKPLSERQHQINLLQQQNFPFLGSIAISLLIHRLCTHLTKVGIMILYFVTISLTNLDSPSIIIIISYNGWTMKCLSVVPTKSITLVPVSPFLQILRFLIPLNAYLLLFAQQMVYRRCQNIRCHDSICVIFAWKTWIDKTSKFYFRFFRFGVHFILGTTEVITHCHQVKTMGN